MMCLREGPACYQLVRLLAFGICVGFVRALSEPGERARRSGCGKLYRARSLLYRNEILQENMRLTAYFKFYKMCTLLHRSSVCIPTSAPPIEKP